MKNRYCLIILFFLITPTASFADILGVGQSKGLWIRDTLTSPWKPIPNSGDVIAVTATSKKFAKMDLSIADWCYSLSNGKISFHPILRNEGYTAWKPSKKGRVAFGCEVMNKARHLAKQHNIDLNEWPKSPSYSPGETFIPNSSGCTWDFPMWNNEDLFELNWLLSHPEDGDSSNNENKSPIKFHAKDIQSGKLDYKKCSSLPFN